MTQQSKQVFAVSHDIWKSITSVYLGPSSSRSLKAEYTVQVHCDGTRFNVFTDDHYSDDVFVPLFTYHCPQCLNNEINIIHKDATLVCIRCGFVLRSSFTDEDMKSLDTNISAAFVAKKRSKERREFVVDYQKRKNHFHSWLLRLQGKELLNIEPSEIEEIRAYMTTKCDPNLEWDFQSMKSVLKAMGKPKLFNHIYYLLKILCNKPLVEFSSYHEDILMDMFIRIQEPFKQHRDRRVNMLSYSYLLRKFTEIQGWVHLSDQIVYVKSHTKLYHLDIIWKKICQNVGFPFIRSIQ